MQDSISRQAAIDMLKNRWKKTRNYEGIGDDIAEECELYLKQVPSAQPDVPDTNVGDCISRQAVVKFFNDWISCLDENCHHQSVADMIIIKNDFKNLPSAQPEQRWIPCSVRLPEDDTEVLVYLFENNKSPYIAWVSDGRWYTEDFEVEREDEPVEWMPLPEPYNQALRKETDHEK